MKKLVLLTFLGMLSVCLNKSFAASPAFAHQPDSLVDELLLRNYAEEHLSNWLAF